MERERYSADSSADDSLVNVKVDVKVDSTATTDTADTLQAIADSSAQSASHIESLQSTADSSVTDSSGVAPIATTVESAAPTLATLQAKLTKLQAKLHKEFRWYCDTILQGGSLAVRVAYRVHIATEVLSMVDRGEVRDDPALGEYCILIGGSLYCESDIDKLLTVEYLLDDLYDTWCRMHGGKMSHTDEEWSDTVDRYLDTVDGMYPNT